MISIILAKKIVSLFLIMCVGYALVKTKLLKSEDSKVISVLAIYAIVPCVMLKAFQVEYSSAIMDGIKLAFVGAIIARVMLTLVCTLLIKVGKLNAVEAATATYANSGNFLVPLVAAVLGPEWLIYSSTFVMVQLVFFWTHGNTLLAEEEHFNWKKIVLNVNVLSMLVGFIFFLLKIHFPAPIQDALLSLARMTGPAAMLVVGMVLGRMDFKRFLVYKRLPLVVFLRLIAVPLIILPLLKYTGLANLHPQGKYILFITFLAVTAPSASIITNLCQIYNNQPEYAGVINAATLLGCIISMPLMAWLYFL